MPLERVRRQNGVFVMLEDIRIEPIQEDTIMTALPLFRRTILTLACAALFAGFASPAAPADTSSALAPPIFSASALLVGDCVPGADWPAARADADRLVALVNQHRATLGLRALKISPTLTASAVWKSRHMAMYFLSSYGGMLLHDDPAPPVYRTAAERVAACGYPTWAGENIASGFTSPESVMQGWLGSPGHRAHIESPNYVVIGVAGAGTLWTQNFGTFDDSNPLRVELRAFRASRVGAGTLLKWRTASELDTLGFHVYREVNGKRVRANTRMIAAKGRGSYSFLDRKAPKAKSVRYWVQEVAADGSRSWYGPARVSRT